MRSASLDDRGSVTLGESEISTKASRRTLSTPQRRASARKALGMWKLVMDMGSGGDAAADAAADAADATEASSASADVVSQSPGSCVRCDGVSSSSRLWGATTNNNGTQHNKVTHQIFLPSKLEQTKKNHQRRRGGERCAARITTRSPNRMHEEGDGAGVHRRKLAQKMVKQQPPAGWRERLAHEKRHHGLQPDPAPLVELNLLGGILQHGCGQLGSQHGAVLGPCGRVVDAGEEYCRQGWRKLQQHSHRHALRQGLHCRVIVLPSLESSQMPLR